MSGTGNTKLTSPFRMVCASKFYVTNETTYDIIKIYKRK